MSNEERATKRPAAVCEERATAWDAKRPQPHGLHPRFPRHGTRVWKDPCLDGIGKPLHFLLVFLKALDEAELGPGAIEVVVGPVDAEVGVAR